MFFLGSHFYSYESQSNSLYRYYLERKLFRGYFFANSRIEGLLSLLISLINEIF